MRPSGSIQTFRMMSDKDPMGKVLDKSGERDLHLSHNFSLIEEIKSLSFWNYFIGILSLQFLFCQSSHFPPPVAQPLTSVPSLAFEGEIRIFCCQSVIYLHQLDLTSRLTILYYATLQPLIISSFFYQRNSSYYGTFCLWKSLFRFENLMTRSSVPTTL